MALKLKNGSDDHRFYRSRLHNREPFKRPDELSFSIENKGSVCAFMLHLKVLSVKRK